VASRPYPRHIVFSIPKILRCCFLYDRKRLTDLSRCGWECLKAYFTSCSRHNDALPGAVINPNKTDYRNPQPKVFFLFVSRATPCIRDFFLFNKWYRLLQKCEKTW